MLLTAMETNTKHFFLLITDSYRTILLFDYNIFASLVQSVQSNGANRVDQAWIPGTDPPSRYYLA